MDSTTPEKETSGKRQFLKAVSDWEVIGPHQKETRIDQVPEKEDLSGGRAWNTFEIECWQCQICRTYTTGRLLVDLTPDGCSTDPNWESLDRMDRHTRDLKQGNLLLPADSKGHQAGVIELRTWCVFCVTSKHTDSADKPYMTNEKGQIRLTARWKHLQRRQRGKVPNDCSQRKLNSKVAVSGAGKLLNLSQIHDEYTINALLAASDWVTGLFSHMFILYGCTYCHRYPLKGCHWWRMSSSMEYSPESKRKKWRCPFCTKEFDSWTGKKYRLIVFADPESNNPEAVSYTHLTLPTNREV